MYTIPFVRVALFSSYYFSCAAIALVNVMLVVLIPPSPDIAVVVGPWQQQYSCVEFRVILVSEFGPFPGSNPNGPSKYALLFVCRRLSDDDVWVLQMSKLCHFEANADARTAEKRRSATSKNRTQTWPRCQSLTDESTTTTIMYSCVGTALSRSGEEKKLNRTRSF